MTQPITALGAALRTLGEHGDRITLLQPAPEDLDGIRDDLDTARRLLAAARASMARRCPQHPNVPLDPVAGGACLLCATSQRRAQLATTTGPVVQAVPLETVARTVAELGQDEAMRRYGARTVTRALLRCRLDPMLTEESA